MERKLKDSGHPWIGVIPEHWELHCLRGIANAFSKGNGITKEDLNPDGDISCVRYGDLYTRYNHFITDVYCKTNMTSIQNAVHSCYGDIYFTCSGEDVNLIGKSVAFLSKEPCLVGGDLIIMKHSQNPRFLGYSLDSYVSQKQKSCGKSKLKVVHTSVKDLKNIVIALPPLAEQEQIAAYLDKKCGEIDELIDVEQQMIADLEAYRQSVITEAVTRGLNPNVPTKYSGSDWIGQIPEHWEIVPVQHFFEFRNGYTPSKANASFWTNGTIPWFRMEDIRKSGRFLKQALQYITPEAMNNGGTFDAGSFILAICTASIGEHALLIADSLANQQFTNLKIRKSLACSVHTQYMYYYMFILGRFCKETSIVTTFPYADMNRVKSFIVPKPPLAEQQSIADFLDRKCSEINDLIKVKQEKIETLKQYRQSLIFEAVTGKIEIE